MSRRERVRPRRSGVDPLGLRRALADRLLPFVVGGMAFLAAVALAGVYASSALARYWQQGAAASLTIQVPDPGGGRLDRVLAAVVATPGVRAARALPQSELDALLAPWLGQGAGRIALPVPGVVAVQVERGIPELAARVEAEAPGSSVEAPGEWAARLAALARSLQACAALAMAVVGAVAVAIVVVASRSGIAARRDTIEVVHGLGATDGFIAGRFARRVARLVAMGGLAGSVLAVPVLLWLVRLATPLVGGAPSATLLETAASVPHPLWLALPSIPVLAGAVAWLTAQVTVRQWLRRLP